ncbi:MAG TPA: acetyl-coenzyme A synthetase N-terminal domain-containing protein, partial [Pirellulales bacterium]|nr:acetyl-coenzyme A synthetase N-terminal domain-containing protein [Pirellulales bacterium]
MTENALWTPPAERVARSRMTAFTQFASKRHDVELADYHALWTWSVEHREQFWSAVWDFSEVVASQRWQEVLVDGDRMPGARWFTGARLNFAANLLRIRDDR